MVDGDPRQLGFLAGVHGDRLAAVGPTVTTGPGAPEAPVEVAAIVETARRLLAAAGGG
ncbi:hypothetical protein [Pseudofrankia saprophytica]|uniref:hypothetical protein n=1 Tax=Pseudofrankia saprophytica TaxID=298655 RepID=UPI001E6382DF|nr:hypothetical protein [Pseudofrankia saprophytica]